MRGKRQGLQALRMATKRSEGVANDGAGGTENDDLLHQAKPQSRRPSNITGTAATMLSTRSSMPPCPGNICPMSLSPTLRLSIDSVSAPMIETTAALIDSAPMTASAPSARTSTEILHPTPPQTTHPTNEKRTH